MTNMTDELNEDKKVKLTQKEYDAITNKLSTLQDQVGKLENKGIVDWDEETQHTATVRQIDGKWVVATGQAKVKKDSNQIFGDMEMEIVLRGKEGDEKRMVDYLDFIRNADKVRVKILETRMTYRGISVQGKVEASEVKDYRTLGTGVYVPLRVITPAYESDVELPGGEKLTINNRFLNI